MQRPRYPVERFLTHYNPVDAEVREQIDRVRDKYAALVRALEWLPENAERTAGMRKILEAKDCHVRCLIQAEDEGEDSSEAVGP